MSGSILTNRPRLVPVVVACLLLTGWLIPAWATTYMIPMRDGTRLATDVYLPEGEGPWPTILIRTPYGRGNLPEFVSWGYAVVSQDWRGFGGSGGEKKLFEPDGWGELQDGYDTVEWITEQDWSDRKVGTWGYSYPGAVENLMAGSYPPNLICQNIRNAASDLYSQGFYPGGVFEKWNEHWHNQNAPEDIGRALSHPNYDSYWDLMNSETRSSGMTYPGFHIGGWYDMFSQGTINAFTERQHNGGPGSAGNQKLVMGPWTHKGCGQLGGFVSTTQGELTYPANSQYTDDLSDTKMFFDYWLKGIDNGYTEIPTVRYYVMGDVDDPDAPGNEWKSADDWPVPYTNFSLYLSQNKLVEQPRPESSCTYSYDPGNPAPTLGGRVYPAYIQTAGPRDQRSVEQREDVLAYTTDPLPVPVEVTGRIYVQLFASSSCPDTDFMAKLTDVYPDGRSMLVADAAIRARHRNSMETEEFMEPGEVYEFWIDLWSTSIVFNKGHRIRVDITSSNYPRLDPNPNTGHPDGETNVAENTIHTGTTYPTRIILPLAGPDSDGDGVYDIQDPLPHQAGPHTQEDLSQIIQRNSQRITTIEDPNLRSMLEQASQHANILLAQGDLAASGHLAALIGEALSYDPHEVLLTEAREMYDAATEMATECAEEEDYQTMILYLETGWRLGTIRQMVERLPGKPLLVQSLKKAEDSMQAALPVEAIKIADWCNTTSVQQLAEQIQLYDDSWQDIANAASERDVKILEGLLNAAKSGFEDTNDETCEAKLGQFKQRLVQLGIQIEAVEPALLPILTILGLILLPTHLRRR